MTRNQKHFALLGIVGAIVSGAILHWQSRLRRVDVMAFDVGVFLDDGIVVADVPLVRHSSKMPFLNSILIYERKNTSADWKAIFGETLHGRPVSPIRDWFTQTRMQNVSEYAGFGYLVLDNQYNKHRPGRSTMLFMPVWAATIVACVTFIALASCRPRWSIRAMGIAVLASAVFLRLATLTD